MRFRRNVVWCLLAVAALAAATLWRVWRARVASDKPPHPDCRRLRQQRLREWAEAEAGEGAGEGARAARDGAWQPVAGTTCKFFVFSAFIERRAAAGGPAVRVVGATVSVCPEPVLCRLYLTDGTTVTVEGEVKVIQENWNLKYSAVFVLCPLGRGAAGAAGAVESAAGGAVAVLSALAPRAESANLLRVRDTQPQPRGMDDLHVCVKPLYGSVRRERLVEWLELQLLLGVSHFYMYNRSTGAADCALAAYQRHGLVTLLPWDLPMQSEVEIRRQGICAALNDCLNRASGRARWLLALDLDEVVLPRREGALPALLDALAALTVKPPAALVFQNVFFYLQWPDDPSAPAPLLTSRKTLRLRAPQDERSRYAVQPRATVELGNHCAWQLLAGAATVAVPPARGLLHHYRDGAPPNDTATRDRTAQRWARPLARRVAAVARTLRSQCPDYPRATASNTTTT